MYTEKQQRELNELNRNIQQVERQAQKNLNARLDNMRFCDYTRTEFDNTAPHAETDISFVLETDQSISLYKGDTQLSSQGSGVDVLYAALVGYGTGLGGERTGDQELYYSQTTDKREIIEEMPESPYDSMGYYLQDMAFWKDEHGTIWGNSYSTRTTLAYLKGLGDFKSTPHVATAIPIICNRTKAVVSTNVRGVDGESILGYDVNDFLSYTSFLYQKTFYVRRILENGYGSRETLTFSVEPYGFSYSGNRTTREVSQYAVWWKVKVSDGTNERYLNGVYLDSPSQYMRADNDNGMLPNAGFTLGFESIQHIDDDILYGQLRGPGLLWRGTTIIKETSDNPYGFYYDIATGNPITGEPTVEFYNKDERDMAYCLCLPRRTDI